ncbi:MAG: hypothetical protein ACK56I_03730, partial [bacterium]
SVRACILPGELELLILRPALRRPTQRQITHPELSAAKTGTMQMRMRAAGCRMVVRRGLTQII